MTCLQRSYLFLELTIHTLNLRLPSQDSKTLSNGIQLTEQCKIAELQASRKLPVILFSFSPRNINLIRILSVSKMGKCPFEPGHIQPLYELSHVLHSLFAVYLGEKRKPR